MYVSFKGKSATLYNDDRVIVRKFLAKANIVNAQVSGAGDTAIVALTTTDGKTVLYKSNGQIIRK